MKTQYFSLTELSKLIFKYKWLIFLFSLIGIGISTSLAVFVIKPEYQVGEKVLVISNNGNSLQQMNTYMQFIKSPEILNEVKQQFGRGVTEKEIELMVQVRTDESSQIINVLVNDHSIDEAREIGRLVTQEFIKKAPKIWGENNLKLLNWSSSDSSMLLFPKKRIFALVGFLAGIIFGIVMSFNKEIFSKNIKNKNDLVAFGLPVLGTFELVMENKEKVTNKKKRD